MMMGLHSTTTTKHPPPPPPPPTPPPFLRRIHSSRTTSSHLPSHPPTSFTFQLSRLRQRPVVVPKWFFQYSNSIVIIMKQIILSVWTIDTIMGIKIGFCLFLLLQSFSHSGSDNPTISSTSSSSISSSSSSVIPPPPIVIGYAVSITGCGPDPITEGAAILQHSIHRTSIRHSSTSTSDSTTSTSDSSDTHKGRYDYQMYAIYHPSAKECAMPLQALGYTLLERETPVSVSDIQGEYLRTHIAQNGCCGDTELIKLYAYTLVQHPLVVHLDLDTILLQPLDPLFDYMLLSLDTSSNSNNNNHHPESSSSSPPSNEQIHQRMKDMVMWPDQFPPLSSTHTTTTINAMFTYDYNMVTPKTLYKPVQGGFLLLRPNIQVYEEFQQLIRIGDFREGSGWGGQVGPFYGSMTFQGIIPYYYNIIHPHQGLELNRCYTNTMADNPRTQKTIQNVVQGPCRTGQSEEQCQDCRTVPLSQIYSVHYTICQKPWSCLSHSEDILQHRLCRQLTHEWYQIRKEYQNHVVGDGTYDVNQFYGYCHSSGSKGYQPIPKQYYHARSSVTSDTK